MNYWTEEEDTILKLNYPDKGASGCASLLNRSILAIRGRAYTLGIKSNNTLNTKHTHEWYEAELFRKEIDHYPLEKYEGYDIPIKHECLNGHITLRPPSSVLRGMGCTVCLGLNKRSSEEYINLLTEKNIIYEPLEKYIDTDTKILHKCPICNNQWSIRPSSILKGTGCPKCKRPGGYSLTFFENNPDIANSPGICYLVVLVDKESHKKIGYKIGITKGSTNKDVLKRAKGISPYEVRVLKFEKGTLIDMFILEQKLHSKWRNYKLVPDKAFGGMQECFELNDIILKTFPKID